MELQDLVNGKDTEAAELRNQIDDLQYEVRKVTARNDKLENALAEAVEKIKTYKQMQQTEEKGPEKGKPVVTSVSQKKVILNKIFLFLEIPARKGKTKNVFIF